MGALVAFALQALWARPLRTVLSALGVAVGVLAVTVLTSLGEGTRRFILAQFTQFGTNLIAVNPGKVKTLGIPGVFGGGVQKLTLEDAEALRRVPGVDKLTPVVMGQARVEFGNRGRSVYVYGTGHEANQVWRFHVAQGSYLPPIDPHRQAAVAVLGPKLAQELFGSSSPLGQRVRIGGRPFLVIGVMEPKGRLLGFDLDDSCYIPVASAMALFRAAELTEIDLTAVSAEAIPRVVVGIKTTLAARHRGEEDFTVTTQNEMLDTLGRVMEIVTVAVSGIGGISLLVGAIGILTIMWISVHERTAEIGLLRALGVERSTVLALFLLEASLLAAAGGLLGLAASFLLGLVLRTAIPGFPFATPPGAVVAALLVSAVVGLGAGVLPARRAAQVDPIEALREE
ncbi:MAG: ABC transporter permease [Thermoanaerobaculum sp.]|nr:ABC transporter permease [Thermoanaerobaculum sp.]MDW7968325.1 ABC transporter permease [Thermoanaerobaculum sp.]